jgi:tight adherence protein B
MPTDVALYAIAGTFAVVIAIIVGAYFLFIVRPEDQEQQQIRKRLKGEAGPAPDRLKLLRSVKGNSLSSVGAFRTVLERTGGFSGPLQRLIAQAGLDLSVSTLLLLILVAGAAGFTVTYLITRMTVIALIAMLLGAWIPVMYVRWKRTQRMKQFEEQFPEAVDLIARTLRAGHAFTTGVKLAAEELPEPVASEFQLLYDRQNFGLPLPDALRGFAARVPILDARFFATAVLTQREAGGNLAEVLDNLGGVIRERFKVKRQVRVMSAHGRMTGWVLATLPPALAVAFMARSPEHFRILLDDPMGPTLIVTAILLQVIGTLIIRKLVNIEY